MGRFHRHDTDDHGHGDHDGHEHANGSGKGHLGDHTGYRTGPERIDVLERIFAENDDTAAANRADFDDAAVTAVNLMSSPGAGETSVLRETLRRRPHLRLGVIEGDIETSLDPIGSPASARPSA